MRKLTICLLLILNAATAFLWFGGRAPFDHAAARAAVASNEAVADFACPRPGTAFVLSQPMEMSTDPGFHSLVKIAGSTGYDCHILNQTGRDSWDHAGLIEGDQSAALRAAAEQLWPLKLGNKTHADFEESGRAFSVDYEVAAYEPFVAWVGAYEAFKVVETVREDGKLVFTATRWWSPALRYTLSYRIVRADAKSDAAWEIAEIIGRPS